MFSVQQNNMNLDLQSDIFPAYDVVPANSEALIYCREIQHNKPDCYMNGIFYAPLTKFYRFSFHITISTKDEKSLSPNSVEVHLIKHTIEEGATSLANVSLTSNCSRLKKVSPVYLDFNDRVYLKLKNNSTDDILIRYCNFCGNFI